MKFLAFAAVLAVLISGSAQADLVTLSPATINGGNTNTASYDDAFITLTPQVRDASNTLVDSTFNANANRLGIDGNGTNDNAFNDGDTTSGNVGDEALLLEFKGTAGFAGISWDFSRADGPLATDGIQISGFLYDPGAVLSGITSGASVSYDAGVVNLQLSNDSFVADDGILTFSDTLASEGQTILLTVGDSTQANAQFAVTNITYETVAVPEPSSAGVIALFACGAGFFRRRKNS